MCYRRCGVENHGVVIHRWASQKWRNHAVERWFTIPIARENGSVQVPYLPELDGLLERVRIPASEIHSALLSPVTCIDMRRLRSKCFWMRGLSAKSKSQLAQFATAPASTYT